MYLEDHLTEILTCPDIWGSQFFDSNENISTQKKLESTSKANIYIYQEQDS